MSKEQKYSSAYAMIAALNGTVSDEELKNTVDESFGIKLPPNRLCVDNGGFVEKGKDGILKIVTKAKKVRAPKAPKEPKEPKEPKQPEAPKTAKKAGTTKVISRKTVPSTPSDE